jgi:hypothetical protein
MTPDPADISAEKLAAQFEGFKKQMEERTIWMTKFLEERDLRYAQLSEAKEKALVAALAASDKAVSVAERNAEKWRDSANEWRAAMTDKDRNFVTKTVLWGYCVGMLSFVVALVSLLRVFIK